MFDYPLSILVGQKTSSHLLRQNLFPALRARGRAEFVRREGIVIPLDSNKILGVSRNHASAKNTVRGHGAFLSTDSTGPAVRTTRSHARVSLTLLLVYDRPICLGPRSLSRNCAVEMAGKVVMLTEPREPRSIERWAAVSLSGASTILTKS